MENTQQTGQVEMNYNITLENVPYNDNFRIKSGSLAQLMRGLQVMQDKISSDKETDEYKKILYPKLRELSSNLVSNFIVLLSSSNEKERNVKQYNLCGYDGQIRADHFRRYPFVKGVNPNAKYGFSNFGYYLRMLKQRLEFIAGRDLPARYSGDEVMTNTFNYLKVECDTLLKYLTDTVEPEWNKIVDEARQSGGEVVKKNLQSRIERREERNANTNRRGRGRGFGRGRGPGRGRGSFRGKSSESNRGRSSFRGRGQGQSEFKGPRFVKKYQNITDNENNQEVLPKRVNGKYISKRGSGSFRGRNFNNARYMVSQN